jgi:hypothetical protein
VRGWRGAVRQAVLRRGLGATKPMPCQAPASASASTGGQGLRQQSTQQRAAPHPL